MILKRSTRSWLKSKSSYETISRLSNDELRDKTVEFRKKIAEAISEEMSQIEAIKLQIEAEEDIMEREKLWERSINMKKKVTG